MTPTNATYKNFKILSVATEKNNKNITESKD